MDGRKMDYNFMFGSIGSNSLWMYTTNLEFKRAVLYFSYFRIIVGIIAGFDANTICKEFLNGCKIMLGARFIIGLARSIGSIMADGQIIDTVVHSLLKC